MSSVGQRRYTVAETYLTGPQFRQMVARIERPQRHTRRQGEGYMARYHGFEGFTSRRDFLKLAAAGAASASAGATWRPRKADAKPTQITFMRESSYVKEFDEHFKNVLIPRYQAETGIKIVYEIIAAGGSAVPRTVAIVESKAPLDARWVQQEWLDPEGLLDVSDIAKDVGKQQGGWDSEIEGLSGGGGKGRAVPFRHICPGIG